jgi:hypothetical protein
MLMLKQKVTDGTAEADLQRGSYLRHAGQRAEGANESGSQGRRWCLLHYVIAVAEDGRFFPVALPSADQVQIACDLAINFNIASARV